MSGPEHPHHPHRLSDALHFLSRFITRPGSIGSIWPSSRQLGEAMIDQLPMKSGDVVVEYGPGTGPFTSVLRERMPQGVEYLGIEFDPELHRNLVRRFPGMRFHHGSAESTPEILSHHNLGPAKFVVSGLPFANMPPDLQERILKSTRDALCHDGVFRTFTYLLSTLNPSTIHFRRLMKEHFLEHHTAKTVMNNFPPARVLSYSRPVQNG
jgi:phosphatidylethanolamine/phosphatidyl-N-methylethanolamine N-methyltransferase